MENVIFWLLVAIALLVCAIAWLIIYISGLQQKLKVSDASNREIYKGYKAEQEKNADVKKELDYKSLLLEETKRGLAHYKKLYEHVYDLYQNLKKNYNRLNKLQYGKKPTTADFKQAIIKDYKKGADVYDIATKYGLKANTVFKAIARRKAKGDIK